MTRGQSITQKAIMEALSIDREKLHDNCYIWVKRSWVSGQDRYNDLRLEMLVSEAPGGAWSYFGCCNLEDTMIKIEVKTTHGIINHISSFHQSQYPYAMPGLIQMLLGFFKKEAERCRLAFREGHERAWENYYKQLRHGVQ